MKSNKPNKRKEGNVLFKDTINTIYLWLYGVGKRTIQIAVSKFYHGVSD